MVVPFEESLHPRAQGGRFGVKQQGRDKQQLARQLRERARAFRARARELSVQLDEITNQIHLIRRGVTQRSGKVHTTHATTKGSKSGSTGKVKAGKVKTAAQKAKDAKTVSPQVQQVAHLQTQATTIRAQIHLLKTRASEMDKQAREL